MRKHFSGRRPPVENKGSYLRCAGRCGRYRLCVDFNPRRRRALYVANACGCGNRRYSRLEKGLSTILIYILLGLVGVPVFAGFKSGVPALMGATGGYIFGFAFAVVISGLAKLIPVKNKFARIGVFFAANILGLTICYVFGTAWFITVYGKNVGSIGVKSALMLCVVPYIVPDLVKLFIAAVLSVRLGIYMK